MVINILTNKVIIVVINKFIYLNGLVVIKKEIEAYNKYFNEFYFSVIGFYSHYSSFNGQQFKFLKVYFCGDRGQVHPPLPF